MSVREFLRPATECGYLGSWNVPFFLEDDNDVILNTEHNTKMYYFVDSTLRQNTLLNINTWLSSSLLTTYRFRIGILQKSLNRGIRVMKGPYKW